MELRLLHTSHRYDETEQWNGNVVILIKYSSPEVVISEAVVFDAVSDENLMKMLTFPVQGYWNFKRTDGRMSGKNARS